MTLKKEKDILKIIKKNFMLLQKIDFKKNKSKHWNVFSKNFINAFNFENYWYFLENQQSWQQPWAHELLAKRTNLQHIKRPKDILSKLHPFDLKHSSSFKDILFVLKNFLRTNDERTYPNSLNVKFKNIYLNLIRRNIE